MKTLISVNEEHIRNGVPETIDTCPIALAIKEKLGQDIKTVITENYLGYDIYGESSFFGTKLDRIECHQPRSVKKFISKFDKMRTGKPFKFWLKKV